MRTARNLAGAQHADLRAPDAEVNLLQERPPVWAMGKRATAAFGAGLMLLILLIVTNYTITRRMEEASALEAHADEVRSRCNLMLAAAEDVQTGMRGYLLTGQESFLEPYFSGRKTMHAQLAMLRRFVADPGRQRRLQALEPLITAGFDSAGQIVETRSRQGAAAAAALAGNGEVSAVMDEISRRVAEIGDEEALVTRRRQAAADQAASAAGFVIPVGGLLAVALLMTSVLMLNGEVATRRKSEEASRRSEERFRATFDEAAIGFAQVAPDGRWLRVNHKLCEIVGYTREELLTMTFQEITHPEDLETDLGLVRQVLAGELQTYSLEKRYIRKDGAVIWINVTVSLVRDGLNQPSYFISGVEDITAWKHAEEAIRELNASLEGRVAERTAQLEAAVRDLEAFSYSVSHDLRAPLRSIDGFSRILIAQHAAELSPEAREYLQIVRTGTQQMGRLIDDLLAFSRLSRQPLRVEIVSPETLVRQCLDLLHAEVEGRAVEIATGELPACEADAGCCSWSG